MRLPLWLFRWLHQRKLSRRRMHGGFLHNWLGDRILEKALWSPTRESLARAWMIGFPITVMPFLPFQTLFAAVAALFVRGNLMLCIALQFLSTPMTAPVHLPACYFVGELVRGQNPVAVWHHLRETPRDLLRGDAVISLYLGAFIIGILGGAAGYAILQQTWRDSVPRKQREPRDPPKP